MEKFTVQENELIEDKETRERYLSQIDVLEKVKELVTLPETEIMTTRMVAEWFEVTQDVIRDNVRRNKKELEGNGLIFKKYNDIKALVNRENISQLRISKQGTNVFSKRAVLNLAMFLRDSRIAQKVRKNLLDVNEAAPNEIKLNSLDYEKQLTIDVLFAETSNERLLAMENLRDFKNKHLSKLESIISSQTPKVEEHAHYLDSRGLPEMNAVAKSLKVGRNHLFRFLREEDTKVMIKGDIIPYQSYVDRGWFQIIQVTKNGITRSKTLVTPKGVSGISKLLRKHMDKYSYMHRYKDTVFTREELSIEDDLE